MQKICLLGATGSIGSSTLEVMSANPGQFELISASGCRNVDRMLKICQAFHPQTVVMTEADAAEKLSTVLKEHHLEVDVLSGSAALDIIVSEEAVDQVMAAIVGAAGLSATLAAVKANKRVLLANKESLVMSGDLFMQALSQSQATLYPVDSEHNAIFQCLPDGYQIGDTLSGINRILLTGSGGPFRTSALADLKNVTPAQAIAHPNWSMGAKISVDSATMMNKSLEWIEAKWLFGVTDEALELLVHPQSIIHSMVEYTDGSVLAQMGQSDMRIPIAHAMGTPKRIQSGVAYLDFLKLKSLEFEAPNETLFPALRLRREVWQQGGTSMAIFNAANEVAVAHFLNKQIGFLDIMATVEKTLENMPTQAGENLSQIIEDDLTSRNCAERIIKEI